MKYIALEKLCEIIMGQAPPGSKCNKTREGMPFVKAGEFGIDRPKICEWTIKPIKLAQKNDVLICVVGATAGKINLGENCAIGRSVAAIRPNQKRIDQFYLYNYLQTWVSRLRYGSQGSAQTVITKSMLADINIPLPPLPEQKRIAAILDKADAIRRKRQQAIQLADEFLRSVFLDMFGDPVINPKGWEKVKLEKILKNIDNGWSPKCLARKAAAGEWGVLKLGAVTTCQYLGNENKALPSSLEHREQLEVKAGDLLFTRKNTYELVAACAFVFETKPKLMISDTIFRFSLKEDFPILPEYLWALMTHPGKRKQVQRLAGGSAGSMPNISKGRLMKQTIEIPPLKLQEKFRKILYKIKRIETKHSKILEKSENCFHSLTQRAFRGEL